MSAPRAGERFLDLEGRVWRVRDELLRRRPVAELVSGRRPSGEIVADEFGREWRSLDMSSMTGRARAVFVSFEGGAT